MLLLLEHAPKLILASIVGWVVGAERALQKKKKHVGVGTCSVITMSSTLLTIVSAYGFGVNSDPSRLISNIITAIGFLCGGVIFVKSTDDHEDNEVVGLTTGAMLFCLSAIGIAIGLGYYALVLITTILILLNIYIYLKCLKNIYVIVNSKALCLIGIMLFY